MRRPANHASSSNAGGTPVVFPAPGGAVSTAHRPSRNASRSSAIAPSNILPHAPRLPPLYSLASTYSSPSNSGARVDRNSASRYFGRCV